MGFSEGKSGLITSGDDKAVNVTPASSHGRVGAGRLRPWQRLLQQPGLNFALTNRLLPRALLTIAVGRFSKLRSPWLTRLSIAVWRQFAPLDLREARRQRFDSLHDCFVRELKPGARPVDGDPRILTSPSDAIVGACGTLADGLTALQAKGMPYALDELIDDPEAIAALRGGCYVTLRLTSTMYHRFHAPYDGRVERVSYFSGDVWNVNPPALARVGRLFCKNERAHLRYRLRGGPAAGAVLALVPVAAILVASIRLHFLDGLRLHLRYRGPQRIDCDAPFAKGQEMGWFEHGSTILVFAPPGFALAAGIEPGRTIRMGEPLLRLPEEAAPRD
jgi:phosphatidylserine decarboxylase